MKTLEKHVLLYDADCPMCAVYSQAFINADLLDENGREIYACGVKQYADVVDKDIARNKIALVNTETGQVYYGVDSIVKILGHRYPIVSKLANVGFLKFLLFKLYSFISFNRKVIAPSKNYLQQECLPDFSLKYRLLFIMLSGLFTSLVLNRYSFLLTGLVPPSNLIREFLICFGQIAFQSALLLIVKTKKQTAFDYVGNMMTVSLIGGLLLLPALIIAKFILLSTFTSYFFLAYFFLIVGFMFLMHTRRVKWINAPWWLSASWVIYRLIVLLIIM